VISLKPDSNYEIVDAVKELSQNRILLILETNGSIDERDFSVPGVKLNAEISKELLQTIFQPKTLLHDGATLIRGSRIMAAGIILPFLDKAQHHANWVHVTGSDGNYRASRKLYLCGCIRRNWFTFLSRAGNIT